jgi:hypothetical protein
MMHDLHKESFRSSVCAVYDRAKGVNESLGEHIPLLEKEGWMRGQENIAKQP